MSVGRHEAFVSDENVVKAALTFVVLTGFFASFGYYLLIELGIKRYFMGIFMWSPAMAAFSTCKVFGINIRSLGWGLGPSSWGWVAYFIPVFYGLIAYGIIWLGGLGDVVDPAFINEVSDYLGLSNWSDTTIILFAFLMFAVVGVIWRMGAVMGEEIGWRGLLTPLLLQKFSFPITSLIVGIIWGLWHVPILLYTKYNAGPINMELQVMNYFVLTIGLSFILTYLYQRSRSIWVAALLHASHNAFILGVLDPMTIKYEESWRFTGEFGFVLPYVVLAFGMMFWYRAAQTPE